MMRFEWTPNAARAFAEGCKDLNLHGHTVEEVEKVASSMKMLSFFDDEKPVGAAVFHDEQVHIAVIPSYRGRWLTNRILKEFQYALRSCKRALINPINNDAMHFALRMGWRHGGIEKGYLVYVPQ